MAEDGSITTGTAAVELLTTTAYPPRNALSSEIDMVMKGGITSGVVYPLAVCQLARSHRFHSLGGSSAGRIAAGMAAAAEFGRDSGGFNRLARLPLQLGDDLLAIFQPSRGTRPLFDILLGSIDRTPRRRRKVVMGVVRGGLPWFAVTVAVVFALAVLALVVAAGAPHDGGDWLALVVAVLLLLVPGLILGVLAAAGGVVVTGRRRLEANGYGLCLGSKGQEPAPGPGEVEPFTDWLHTRMQSVAGLDPADVLTFGHLWGDPAYDDVPADVAIRLEMMTTNVTHCRPVRLPFESDLYYFCPAELAAYFPPPVFSHLMAHGRPPASGTPRICPDHGQELVHFPRSGKMPVVVAVRMTLSFPVLVSAVPVFAINRAVTPQRPVRCWFSDGGISSNFPIHFFDALWPAHPTFGISLGPTQPGVNRPVYVRNPWATAQPRIRETGTLPGFIGAIADTVQNWSDEGQSMLPGYRDRIVEIRLGADEGGVNINMTADKTLSLCLRGYLAAKELEKFDFAHHRWVRYRTAMAELDKATANMATKWDADLADGEPGYREFVAHLPHGAGEDPGKGWRNAAVARTDELMGFAGRQADGTYRPLAPDFPDREPGPAPDLRIVAHF